MQRTDSARDGSSVARPASRGGRGVYPMRAVLALVLCAVLGACVTTPITGRKAFVGMSLEQDKELGAKAYSEMLAGSKLADQSPQAAQVRKVVDRLVQVAQKDVAIPFDWEVHLIDDPQSVNAWCLPGGKMAVYTGILPVTKTPAGLAVVMGHEIGHAVARHGSERMTQSSGVDLVLAYVNGTYGGDYAALGSQLAALAVILPWGRMQESEADEIGLIYMARAGYDPREAVEFWKRMQSLGGGGGPEWLSTHPSHATRIQDLEALMPRALAEYEAAKKAAP